MAEIDRYFKLMVEHGASDLHLSTGCKPMFRKDGSILPLKNDEPLDSRRIKGLIYEIMPKSNEDEFNETSDTDFAYELDGAGRYRCNIFHDHKGIGGVFRLIPSEILTVQELNLPKAVLNFCTLPKGLVLVTGPTGSGKSTTLAAMIDHINQTRADHIITIEDPIEFVHSNKRCLINQREVGSHTESFSSALRAALREDPDIVLVGEMRDLETTHIAIETAETGHLVFGTLHTTTAIGTVDRLIDQFPAGQQAQIRTMLADALKGVVAQTLIKKIGGGRVAAIEVLVVNQAIAALIREGKCSQMQSVMQTAKKEGMTLLNQEFTRLVKEEIIDPQHAYEKAVDRPDLLRTFQAANVRFQPADAETAAPTAPAPEAAMARAVPAGPEDA
ncbi:MAG: type IV pilus twitching motility protein PilT [Candidatus Hydrogenedentes bacterium]|nr:type IV pilus twitching motility protein PilT [Candidatus Hydrogenedentota bacterium]